MRITPLLELYHKISNVCARAYVNALYHASVAKNRQKCSSTVRVLIPGRAARIFSFAIQKLVLKYVRVKNHWGAVLSEKKRIQKFIHSRPAVPSR